MYGTKVSKRCSSCEGKMKLAIQKGARLVATMRRDIDKFAVRALGFPTTISQWTDKITGANAGGSGRVAQFIRSAGLTS
jgi:hypothetical protein